MKFESSLIKEFAEQHKLTAKTDSCGETVIPGNPRDAKRVEDRPHIFDNGDGRLGVCYLDTGPAPSVAKYRNAQRKMLAAGFVQNQSGDAEGTLLFDPANKEQSKLAIKVVKARPNRQLSPGRLELLKAQGAMLASFRSDNGKNGGFRA